MHFKFIISGILMLTVQKKTNTTCQDISIFEKLIYTVLTIALERLLVTRYCNTLVRDNTASFYLQIKNPIKSIRFKFETCFLFD